jgi:hypothetical protein
MLTLRRYLSERVRLHFRNWLRLSVEQFIVNAVINHETRLAMLEGGSDARRSELAAVESLAQHVSDRVDGIEALLSDDGDDSKEPPPDPTKLPN